MDPSDDLRRNGRRLFLERLSALGIAGALAWERDALAQGERASGLYRASGSVRVNGKPARRGLVIRPGDTVETGAGSWAAFVIGRDAFLVRSATRVETAPSQAGAILTGLLRVATGKILSVFASGAGERRIETPTATIGIRGTGIYIEAGPKRTYACTCYGEAVLQPRDHPGEGETVQTTHHEQPRYIYADSAMPPGQMMQKAPVVNHTDAELILLESLVGRKPPFGDKGYPYK